MTARTQSNGRFAAFFSSMLGVGLLAATGAIFFFACLAEEVLEGNTLAFDQTVRSFIHDHANDALTHVMFFTTFLGSTLFLSIATAVVLVILIVRKLWRSAAVFAVIMAGAVVLNQVLKTSFARDRPAPYFDYPLPVSFSFPSGHALFSFCFYGSLAWMITRNLHNRWAKVAVWISAGVIVLAIGVSRIYLGVHFPSDVAAGYTAAFIWLITVILADMWLSRRSES